MLNSNNSRIDPFDTKKASATELDGNGSVQGDEPDDLGIICFDKGEHRHIFMWSIKRTDQLLALVGKKCLNCENGLTPMDALPLGIAIQKSSKNNPESTI